ncbi:hypothetical protein [Nostoc sp. 'Peltigera malacea cyanobiont' DB3992]|uniref:hypothetical protein n=1 Tax=Nostoc sp. 'Peltigera malacea cyanobiont' DB3992 TaxID=1206980 RepID=UPI000C04AA09|nr:hypothetical protein [Nostoc sp. 'Peltigera malacea cyanobiont' DB3992]PHM10261.1 hypothetical protein CK516_09610 [Nostoc sp. 'Peltigera malacea cyanobiont' DB3992]
MKLSILIDSVLIVTSIALLPEIGGTQIATSNSGEPIAINSNNSSNLSYLKPFDAAFIAYESNLKAQGSPSGSALVSQYQTGNLTALNVVKTAVNAKKLPAQALNHKGYLNAVESQLTSDDSTNDLSY